MRRGAATGDGITRFEESARARRERAQAHLAKLRARGGRPDPRSLGRGHGLRLAVALSVALGALLGRVFAAGERPLAAIWVTGAERLSAEEVARASGVRPGARLRAGAASAAASALASDPRILEAHATRLPRGDLALAVRERSAAATVALGAPPALFAVDATGVPFAPAREPEAEALPRLLPARAPELGVADPELARAVELARRLPQLGLPPAREVEVAGAADPEGFALRLEGRPGRFVVGREPERVEAALARLLELLEANLPELAGAARIDLRFEDQAILGLTKGG
jgi:cell division septal protein FtsQ